MSPRVVPGATWCGASPTVIRIGGGDGGTAGWQAARVAQNASTALHHAKRKELPAIGAFI